MKQQINEYRFFAKPLTLCDIEMSQINFFLTKNEIAQRLNAIIRSGPFLIFKGNAFDSQTPEPIKNYEQLGDFKSVTLWLINNAKHPLATIKGANSCEGQFLFDYLKDPIIDIENCSYSGNLISPGRVYFKAGWIEDNVLRTMHQKEANKILRLFGKNMMKLQKQWRVSEEVKEWVIEGGELELGRNGFRINKENIKVA